ncbi:ATP-dependent zinc metalloprotease FtsH [Butyrivibrio sp. VCD2006]|uniref:ATP-dependent zinc metalloprotease FtsH n=1 Tax=Butyrivibrio sp. VCD2006 TaxID=1280664 RepID=UPI0004219B6D|nr:ATP-dependent zinc metalloprotease FtsH [Butyrivibrio sp. VCD2006]
MDNNYNNNNGAGGEGGPKKQNILLLVVAALVSVLFMTYIMRAVTGTSNKEVTYSEFIKMIEDKKVESVVIESDRINIIPKVSSDELKFNPFSGSTTVLTYYTGKAEDDSTLTKRLLDAGIPVSSEVPDSSSAIISFAVYYVLPILLMWLILSFVFRRMSKGGGPLGIGKNNAKVYMQRETGVTFKDVAGEDEAKESLVEVVDFLHNPGRYVKIGAKLPKGALLVGPPGTGKTLLAKAVAGEAHVPFYSLAGSDFIELYVGVGASRVRELFAEASKNAPCIIFIDEIDAIGRSRDSKYGGGNEEREQTLNQLLSEMDGFDSSKGVLVLGATNRPEILDKALLRPGRFDRRIIVDKPDLKGREEILKVHSKDVKMDETVDLKGIALATSGAVGSDLANMINEAAINAVKAHREYVCQQDLMEAVEQVLVGKEKKDRILSKEERKIVSYHEVGHALISAVQKNTEPVQKITIVPRTMGALGYVMQVPEDEKYLETKDEIIDDIIVSLGGRAAEEVIFNTVTTGAENDIEKATSMARSMITMFGMSDKFGLMQLESIQNRYLDGNRVLNCSPQTEYEVDEEVKKLLADCYDKAKQIIRDHIDTMDKIAQFLIEKETITGKEFMKIYREVENIPEPTEEEMEAAKHGRIYATRPESAAVGENVPIKEKEKKSEEPVPVATEPQPVQQQGYINWQQPQGGTFGQPQGGNYGQQQQGTTFGQPNYNQQPYGQQGTSYNGQPQNKDEADSQQTGGGLFSHVPDDFDEKK